MLCTTPPVVVLVVDLLVKLCQKHERDRRRQRELFLEGILNVLYQDHVKCCTHRPSQCLYCQTLFPYKTLEEHSMTCLSSKFESLLKLEQSVSLQPRDDLVLCPNADKHCSWEGPDRDLQVHLYICEMEEYKPARPKKFRRD